MSRLMARIHIFANILSYWPHFCYWTILKTNYKILFIAPKYWWTVLFQSSLYTPQWFSSQPIFSDQTPKENVFGMFDIIVENHTCSSNSNQPSNPNPQIRNTGICTYYGYYFCLILFALLFLNNESVYNLFIFCIE